MTVIAFTARPGQYVPLLVGLASSLLQVGSHAQDVGFGDATYNPATGRITIQVEYATHWRIDSPQGLLTGPGTQVLLGVLRAFEFSLAEITPEYVSHGTFGRPFTFGPMDLGQIAQTHIPFGELYLLCECPFNAPAKYTPVRYVPEPTPWALALVMTLVASRFGRRTTFCGAMRRVSGL